jgi:hypothetical protein
MAIEHGFGFDFLTFVSLSIKSFQIDTGVLFLRFTGRRTQNLTSATFSEQSSPSNNLAEKSEKTVLMF